MALNRGAEDFTDEEVELFDQLRPHLVQAYRNIQLVQQHRLALDRVADALEDEGRSFHVLGGPLGDFGVRHPRRHRVGLDRLPDVVATWIEESSSLASSAPAPAPALVSMQAGRRLTIRFVPGGAGSPLLWLTEGTSESDATDLQRLGLTPREAEVLWLLARGRSAAAIARELSISVGTAKKHLEHVYRKLGVSTATAAAAAAFDALS